jgi:hypothetical protein
VSSSDGRHGNPVCQKPAEIVVIFDHARYFGAIDGRDRQAWAADAAPAALVSYTPKFDMVARFVYCCTVLCVCGGVLRCAVLWCAVVWCAVVSYAVLCCAVLWYAVLCCAVVCCAVVWCGVLCCAVLW